ncbi:MAG: MFS transporter [Deltaproteobacteria bacterium]|nr:MFS transporter [Deltaproteobacteria bacterium]
MNRRGTTLVLCFVVMLHNAQRLVPVSLTTELCDRLASNYLGVGNLFSIYLFGTALANIPIGILADRYGSKELITFGTGLSLVLSVVFAVTQTYWIALSARFGLGVASSMLFIPALRYVVSAIPKERRGSVMGYIQAATGVGMIISLSVLPALASRFDLTRAFMLLPIMASCVLLIVGIRLYPVRPKSKPVIWKQIGSLSRDSAFWNMSAFHFLTMLTVYAVLGWLPTYLRLDFGYSATEAGIISSFINIALSFFSPLTGYISDRAGSRTPIMVFGSLLSAVCFAVFIISGNKVLIILSILALGLSKALTIPLSQVLVGEMFSGIGSGLAVAATNTAGRLAASIPGAVGGYILQTTGTFSAIWALALIFGAGRVPFLLAVGEKRRSL